VTGEVVWAKPIGNQLYQIDNIPVFSDEYHLHDIVACEDTSNGTLVARELKQASGNRTLRIQLTKTLSNPVYERLAQRLKQVEVEWATGFTGACAFNLRPNVDDAKVRELLLSEIGNNKFYFLNE
jgi:hypothetical protein